MSRGHVDGSNNRLGRAYATDDDGRKVYCDTEGGERLMREHDARDKTDAEAEAEIDEYYAGLPSEAEMLEDAIAAAAAAGVGRGQVDAVLDQVFAIGGDDDPFGLVIAAARITGLIPRDRQ